MLNRCSRASSAGTSACPSIPWGTSIGSHGSMTAAPGFPASAIAGGSYRGVGVPNCIESGERAVSKILGEWGMNLAEDHAEEKRSY